jgi:LmbE family N-acetylglucosaminyl deacetylase
MTLASEEIAAVRAREAAAAARCLGATLYPSLAHDLEITYDLALLRRIASVVRVVNPSIVLTHALEDYMEDHMATARLAVTAAFAKVIPNFQTEPHREAVQGDVAVYHAMPHGLRDPLRRPVRPEAVVDTTEVHERKRVALAAHASQKDWLDETQGMGSYLAAMDEESRAVAEMAGDGFLWGEGWVRHLHLGMSARDEDPMERVLGDRYHRLP